MSGRQPHRFVRFLVALGLLGVGFILPPIVSAVLGGGGSGLACFVIPVALVIGALVWRGLATVVALYRLARGKEPPKLAAGAFVLVPFGLLGGLFAALFEGPSAAMLVALGLGGLALSTVAYLLAKLGWLDPDLGEGSEF